MIPIKKEDSLIDIIEKIQAQTQGDIILDIPLWHPVLHNYISLKLIKSKTGKERKCIIATSDRIGRRIGKSLGIEYSHIKNSDFIEENTSQNILQHNFTLWEYFIFQLSSYKKEIFSFFETHKKMNSLWKYSKNYKDRYFIHIFFIGFLVSLWIFLFIYYFAITKSYIYIYPEINVKKEAYNFIFTKKYWTNTSTNDKIVPLENITSSISLQESFPSTWIQKDETQKSQGRIQIFNITPEEIQLKPQTRFQTLSGSIVFVSKNWVNIPAWVKDNFWNISAGTVEVDVIAQIKDGMWNYIGSNGNIPKDTRLFLPWLWEDYKEKIYAQSIANFEGWNDTIIKIISENDIEDAKKAFTEKLKNESIKKLLEEIRAKNELNHSQIKLLTGEKSIQYKDIQIYVPEDIVSGKTLDNFSISWSITLDSYTYDATWILQKMKSIINEKYIEWVEKIYKIEEDSLRISEVLSLQENPFEMKATVEIESLFLLDFLHNENTYIPQLKEKIRGMNKSEAQDILINDPHIRKAEISLRPFFVKRISTIESNIIFEVR